MGCESKKEEVMPKIKDVIEQQIVGDPVSTSNQAEHGTHHIFCVSL